MFTPEAAAVLEALQHGELTIKGRFLWGSNYTFLAEVEHNHHKIQAVYKPTRGERPLWDFPSASLAHREVAAYLVSQALGWGMVPETVYRRKAPVGPGSLQRFIEHDSEQHYFNLTEEDHQKLRPVALFDVLVNNADRKGGHILQDNAGHIWLIDHGLCFHVEDKLRTVIWDFIGEPIPGDLCSELVDFAMRLKPVNGLTSELAVQLMGYLSRGEVRALGSRAERLAASGRFPAPDPYRRAFPWPQI